MSASSVGKALSGVTGVPLKSFALLRCSLLEDEEELCYLCLSRYALFVVDRLLEGANGQGILYGAPYRVLERVETDVGNAELFALCFLPKVPLVSRHRAYLLGRSVALTFCSFTRSLSSRSRSLRSLPSLFRVRRCQGGSSPNASCFARRSASVS
jgi:hypothetical protein